MAGITPYHHQPWVLNIAQIYGQWSILHVLAPWCSMYDMRSYVSHYLPTFELTSSNQTWLAGKSSISRWFSHLHIIVLITGGYFLGDFWGKSEGFCQNPRGGRLPYAAQLLQGQGFQVNHVDLLPLSHVRPRFKPYRSENPTGVS